MTVCFVPTCGHYSEKSVCRMFTFPKKLVDRIRWKFAVRNKYASPTKHSRVCSCHFPNGQRVGTPSIFPWNAGKRFSARTPDRKRRGTCKASKGSHQSHPVCRNLTSVFNEENSEAFRSGQSHVTPSSSVFPHSPAQLTLPPIAQQSPDPPLSSVLHDAPPEELFNGRSPHSPAQPDLPFIAQQSPDIPLPSHIQNPSNEDVFDENTAILSQPTNAEKAGGNEQLLMEENTRLRKELEELKKVALGKSTVVHEAENMFLKAEVKRLQESLESSKDVFSFSKISDRSDLVRHFTGLPNKEIFYALLKLFDNVDDIQFLYGWKVTRLSKEDQLFLTLLKLRRGLSHTDLRLRFQISRTTVTNIFASWLLVLHHVLVEDLMATVPSREKNKKHLPACFKGFEDTRMVIDCTEISTSNPSLLSHQKIMFSNYKQKITSKGLIGVSPNGVVTYVSKLYAGSTSDKNVVLESGILNSFVPGDAIMADKGFTISDILPDGVKLYIPPFKETPQFTAEQVNETFKIAQARIHVERAINRVKKFKILSFIPQYCAAYASEIFQVCAALTNFQGPLLKCNDDDEQ